MVRPSFLQLPTLRFALGVVLLALLTLPALANTPQSEAKVKAAFLINFPKYVEWPAEAFAEPSSPFVVAIYGDDEIAAEFSRMTQGRSVNGHPLQFRAITSDEECDGRFHILFIGAKKRDPARILEKLRNTPVLTVGDGADFIDKGGVIRLMRRDLNIGMEVNLAGARASQLKISAKMLNLAEVRKRGK